MPSISNLLQQAAQSGGSGASKSGAEEEGSNQSSSPHTPTVSNQNRIEDNKSDEHGESQQAPQRPMPAISDQETSLDKASGGQESKPRDFAKPPSPLGLPNTLLTQEGDGNAPEEQESSAQAKLTEAIQEQKDLLAEFAKVADELQEILSSLEASTFVKRLKAASRKQFEIASILNDTLDGGFGLPRHRIEQQLRAVGEKTSHQQGEQSLNIYHIQSDLDAYFRRKQNLIYKNVLDQMRDMSVVSDVEAISDELLVNLSGRSIAASEFWGDTLDRWAEELVAATESQSSEGGEKDSLPPHLVLKIMKVLQGEMYLRDETRETQATRPALAPDIYEAKVRPLELTQEELRKSVDDVVLEVETLPNASKHFGKEMHLLTLVSDIMRQSRAVLSRPDTGAEVIAAQTEVIELLLQSNRQKNGSAGGGGSSPGSGGQAGSNGASLNDISLDSRESNTSGQTVREVDQSTGHSGKKLPEEFRRGLDHYFNALESN
jgi:hypothetical protein